MKTLMKLGFAAAAVMFANAAPASAATLTSFCEDGGSPWAGGTHPGRCSAGDISTGTYDITTYNAGSFGKNQGLVFKGYGDNSDLDIWQFTATTDFNAYLDAFWFSGYGRNTGKLDAILTDPNGVQTHLTAATSGLFLGTYTAGSYTLQILGAASGSNLYNYDLRVQAVPVPAAALLFGTGLLGAAGAGFRRRKTAKTA